VSVLNKKEIEKAGNNLFYHGVSKVRRSGQDIL
jgi:hypothetical protein